MTCVTGTKVTFVNSNLTINVNDCFLAIRDNELTDVRIRYLNPNHWAGVVVPFRMRCEESVRDAAFDSAAFSVA